MTAPDKTNANIGKVLIVIAVPLLAIGLYAIWWSSMRGWFKSRDALQGAGIGGTGMLLLVGGLWMRQRARLGLAIAIGVGALCGLVVWRAAANDADRRHRDHTETDLAETFWTTCANGTGIPAAAPRAPNGPRPTVLFTQLSNADRHYYWKGDDSWFPSAIETTQLVACFRTEKKMIDTCSYHDARGPQTISTSQYVVTGKVYAAKTGELLGEKIFNGGVPGKCPESIRHKPGESPRGLEGTMTSTEDEVAFVRGFVDQVDAER